MTKAIFVLTTTFAGLFATGEELWKNLLDDPADWPVINTYKDSVRLEFGVPVEGAKKALRVTGLREKDAKDKDTAWSIRSKRVALARQGVKYRLSLFIRSEQTARRTKGAANLSTAIFWYDAAGRALGHKGLMTGLRKGGFERVKLVDVLPAGAAAFEVQLGLDLPDLKKGETICFAGVTLSLVDESAACGAWGPDVEPPAVKLLTPSPTQDAKVPVRLRLTDASGVVWDKVTVAVDGMDRTASCVRAGDEISLPVPTAPWSEGLHVVKVATEDVHGNACEHVKKFLIGEPPSDTPRVTLRDDGVTLVDGKPFFPIGMYNVRKHAFNGNDFDKAIRDLREAGFNVCHSYRFATDPGLWKAAEKYGMKFWFNAMDVGEAFVGTYRHNPQMLAWYIGDDTSSLVTPEAFRDRDENVRAADPTRLTTQADGMRSYLAVDNYQLYADASDVYMPEIYPVYGRPDDTTCVARVVRDVERIWADNAAYGGSRRHAAWPIIQNFKGWDLWKRYPTPEETTAMSFAALVHGAKGITWYTYGATLEKVPEGRGDAGVADDPLAWTVATNLSRRIASLAPVLLARGDEKVGATVLAGPGKDAFGQPSVTALLKRHGGRAYLLAVNATTQHVRVRFAARPEGEAEVLWENRNVRISGQWLEDDFAPFGVHVYRWPLE